MMEAKTTSAETPPTLAEIFRASVIDASTSHFVFELTGRTSKIDQFISIMKDLGLVEVSRTGVAAIGRGPVGMGSRAS